ncbi:SDR family oxidoreductase [Rhodococcus sp. D2-41]|uniref:3-oxoacyl-[acyl-carrier-protein] reductase MabA n=1 Tax=Speluncibacter jeojiensis TaxID=2710754 RepID=A0A9X4LZX9_9ACTN|nr:SDR family NAD(P)-dependent oxidoreductase [Rhodococcus sp. D2-41]MDG3008954.1 SDR family oxidoreductase [Rhodococcus sp. D2-41]MDG3015465.1 SDR family oxidoreductase [Corynebacteriales bacterium D3-21]
MSTNSAGRVAIVTGAGSGIGRASALRFARDGITVVVNDIHPDTAQRTAEMIADAGGSAVAIAGDVTSPADVSGLVDAALDRFGRLDILFNNAGGQQPKPTGQISPPEFAAIVELNLHSMFYGVAAALPVMLEQRAGVILSTTSGAGLGAVPGLAAYGAAKAGMISLTRSIAVEYGPYGIRANVISPGSMDTVGLRRWVDTLPGGVDAYAAQIPSGRLGTAEDIADVAAFLVSDQAAYVNGALVPVDGATHAKLAIPVT